MKFDSPIYDRIRVKPDQEQRKKRMFPVCEWAGCGKPATHRAPKGRGHEGEYWRYCIDHVRAYNQAYNYFAGMPEDAVQAFQKDAVTGHRPTWRMGLNASQRAGGGSRRALFTASSGPTPTSCSRGWAVRGRSPRAARGAPCIRANGRPFIRSASKSTPRRKKSRADSKR